MRWLMLVMLAGLGCAGGGGFETKSGGFETKSGSRLRAVYDGDDAGAMAFTGFRDSQLGVDCELRTADDGKVRCVPPRGRVLYGDSACTQRALEVSVTCDTGIRYVSSLEEMGCQTRAYSFERGALLGTEAWMRGPNGCERSVSTEPVNVYALSAMNSATLVEFTEEDVTVGTLRVRLARGTDGAQVVESLAFGDSGQRCIVYDFLVPPSDLEARSCMPDGVYVTDTDMTGPFSDASCTEKAAYSYRDPECQATNAAPTRALSFVKTTDECRPYVHEAYAVGAPLTSSYSKSWDATQSRFVCGPSPSQPAGGYPPRLDYRLGARLDATSLPRLTAVHRGGGALKSVAYQLEGKIVWTSGGLLDGASADNCTLRTFSDGVQRCLPASATAVAQASQFRYGDAACTRPLFRDATPCPSEKYLLELEPESGPVGCGVPRIKKVLRVGARYTGTQYWTPTPSGCVPFDATTDSLYELGAEVPASQFAAVSRVVE